MHDPVVLVRVARPVHAASPFASALASNCSRYSSRCVSVCSLIADARSRSASHSGTAAAARSRFARTNQSASSCQSVRASSAMNARRGRRVVHGLVRCEDGQLDGATRHRRARRAGQHLGHVVHRQRDALAPREPVEVHEAGHVGGHDRLGAVRREVAQPVAPHLHRHRRLGHRERPAEPAALVGARQIDQLEPPHRAEQRAHLVERSAPAARSASPGPGRAARDSRCAPRRGPRTPPRAAATCATPSSSCR